MIGFERPRYFAGKVLTAEDLEAHARQTVERVYGWDAIAREQKKLYESLL